MYININTVPKLIFGDFFVCASFIDPACLTESNDEKVALSITLVIEIFVITECPFEGLIFSLNAGPTRARTNVHIKNILLSLKNVWFFNRK